MQHWEGRFVKEGKIWGDQPCKSAFHALKLLNKVKVKSILIPGSGYGRNTKLFSDNNYRVTGIEISPTAYNMALDYDPKSNFIKGSVLNMPFSEEKYDAIFCFNVLHLFNEENRLKFMKTCYDQLVEEGYAYFTVFSEKEQSYGKGKEVENNTFESKPGRPVHYFDELDLKKHFQNFKILEMGFIKEKENHGVLGPHTHLLRFIFTKKGKK